MDDTRTPGALPLTLAALSAGAAAIHFGVMPGHFGASVAHGLFFAIVGWAQLAWAAAVLVRPGQGVLMGGAFFNLAVVVIWLVSGTAGFPIGPGAWTPEPVGAPDALCALLEVVVIACSLTLVERGKTGGALTRVKRLAVAGMSGLVAVAVCASFTPSFARSFTTALQPASTDQPADPHGEHQHGGHQHGTVTPNAPTDAQITASDSFVQAARRELAARWPTAKAADNGGYQLWTSAGGVEHLVMPTLLNDGVVLDPTRPEALVYYRRPDRTSVLLGAVFIMPTGQKGPPIGGPLTPWHSHADPCPGSPCEKGPAVVPGAHDMLHLWVVEYPGGPFADESEPALQVATRKLLGG